MGQGNGTTLMGGRATDIRSEGQLLDSRLILIWRVPVRRSCSPPRGRSYCARQPGRERKRPCRPIDNRFIDVRHRRALALFPLNRPENMNALSPERLFESATRSSTSSRRERPRDHRVAPAALQCRYALRRRSRRAPTQSRAVRQPTRKACALSGSPRRHASDTNIQLFWNMQKVNDREGQGYAIAALRARMWGTRDGADEREVWHPGCASPAPAIR